MPDLEVDKDRIVEALKKLEFRTLVGKFMRSNLSGAEAGATKTSKTQVSLALSQPTLEIPNLSRGWDAGFLECEGFDAQEYRGSREDFGGR